MPLVHEARKKAAAARENRERPPWGSSGWSNAGKASWTRGSTAAAAPMAGTPSTPPRSGLGRSVHHQNQKDVASAGTAAPSGSPRGKKKRVVIGGVAQEGVPRPKKSPRKSLAARAAKKLAANAEDRDEDAAPRHDSPRKRSPRKEPASPKASPDPASPEPASPDPASPGHSRSPDPTSSPRSPARSSPATSPASSPGSLFSREFVRVPSHPASPESPGPESARASDPGVVSESRMVGGSVDSNQIHTPVGAGGVYVGGGVDEFAFGSPVREEGDETRDETSGASPSFPPAESPPSFIMTPATRASPLGSNETPPGGSRPDSTPPGGSRRAHEDPSSSLSSVPSTPFTVSRAAKSGTPDPSELLLDGGDPASDVASLSAPGGILHPLTPGGVRPSAVGSSPGAGAWNPDDAAAVSKAAAFASKLLSGAASELAAAQRELKAATAEDDVGTANELVAARTAADSGDVATLAATAEMNASAARARAERRALLQAVAEKSASWVSACVAPNAVAATVLAAALKPRVNPEEARYREATHAQLSAANKTASDLRAELEALEATCETLRRDLQASHAKLDRASRPQVANAEALADERRDASAALAHAKATGRSEALRLRSAVEAAERRAVAAEVRAKEAETSAEERVHQVGIALELAEARALEAQRREAGAREAAEATADARVVAARDRAEASERAFAEERAKLNAALSSLAAAEGKLEALAETAKTARDRALESEAKLREAERSAALAAGTSEAAFETEVSRVVNEHDRVAAETLARVSAELETAKASKESLEMKCEAYETKLSELEKQQEVRVEKQQQSADAERRRLLDELRDARAETKNALDELDQNRVKALEEAEQKADELARAREEREAAKRELEGTRRSVEARVREAEEEARAAKARLDAHRQAAAAELSAEKTAFHKHRREAIEEDARLRRELAVVVANLEGAEAATAGAKAREEETMRKAVELLEAREEEIRRAKDLARAEVRAASERLEAEIRKARGDAECSERRVRDVEAAWKAAETRAEAVVEEERRRRFHAEAEATRWKRERRSHQTGGRRSRSPPGERSHHDRTNERERAERSDWYRSEAREPIGSDAFERDARRGVAEASGAGDGRRDDARRTQSPEARAEATEPRAWTPGLPGMKSPTQRAIFVDELVGNINAL